MLFSVFNLIKFTLFQNDYLWKNFGFSREYNPEVLKQITPSDSESISIEDLMHDTLDDDDDDRFYDPHKGYSKNDFFYNESPFHIMTKTSRKKSDATKRTATVI